MKKLKTLFFVLIALVLIMPQAAQAATRLGGVRSGYISSAFYNDGKQGDVLNSFYVGVFRDKSIIPLLTLRSGLQYAQLGARSYISEDYKIHTLSVPISARVKLGPVSGLAGISANFNVASNGGVQDVNVFDYPLHLGIGFNILIVGVEARYNWGMNDVFDNVSGLKINYLQVGANIAF